MFIKMSKYLIKDAFVAQFVYIPDNETNPLLTGVTKYRSLKNDFVIVVDIVISLQDFFLVNRVTKKILLFLYFS